MDNDLIGKVFNRWKIIGYADDKIYKNGQRAKMLICECQCEKKTIKKIFKSNVLKDKSKSCGCLNREMFIERNKKYNTYDLSGEYGIGYTSNTNEQFYFDLEDYDKIKDYCWLKNSNNYIYTYDFKSGDKSKKLISLHRLVFNLTPEDKTLIDHIDYNAKYDNRKSNLRICNKQENNMNKRLSSNNTSGVTGVSLRSTTNKWHSYISLNKRIHLGYYNNFEDAVIARLKAEKEYFGDFAPQKHLFKQYGID